TGYQPGEVTFSLGAIVPNLQDMPAHLMQAMPMLVLGLAALAWIIVRGLVLRRADGQAGAAARRDLWVGLAVAASWLAVWGLYSAYYWTNLPFLSTLQVARFYLPAIGAIALLGAWLVTRIPGRAWLAGVMSAVVVAAMFGLGVWSFHAMLVAYGLSERACVAQNHCNAPVWLVTPLPNSHVHVHSSLSLGTIPQR